jgi:hypothetical protein
MVVGGRKAVEALVYLQLAFYKERHLRGDRRLALLLSNVSSAKTREQIQNIQYAIEDRNLSLNTGYIPEISSTMSKSLRATVILGKVIVYQRWKSQEVNK